MPEPAIHPAHETWSIRKPAVRAAGGIVTSQHYLASEVGARVLAAGGNAVDAAVATGLAIGTVEPWMSGLGGGGFMIVYVAAEGRAYAVEFGMRAPRGIDPAAYPLADGVDADLFAWPAVVEDRNVLGPLSISVPGFVAGHAAALERFGTHSWREAIGPAVELAQRGMAVDWYATLRIASEAASLARFPETARVYLPGGHVPTTGLGGPAPVIGLGALGGTYARLRDAGPRDFYEGEIARRVVRDCNDAGSPLSAEDLSGYAARIVGADRQRYRDSIVHAAPGLSAGPTLRHALGLLEERLAPSGGRPDADAYLAYASCLLDAWRRRLATMGDVDDSPAPGCTTHLGVADRDGNVVALTQTLLSIFGSRVVLPGTGILMNNGMMWFDPRPGRPNSIAPGKWPLSNMCPTVVGAFRRSAHLGRCVGRTTDHARRLSARVVPRRLFDVHGRCDAHAPDRRERCAARHRGPCAFGGRDCRTGRAPRRADGSARDLPVVLCESESRRLRGRRGRVGRRGLRDLALGECGRCGMT